MQDELLANHKQADLRVYAVWFSMYPTDLRERWPADVLTDARVVHWWDEKKVVGRWYAERAESMKDRLAEGSVPLGGTILWDSYLVYGPESRWEDAPTGLRRWGRTILQTREALQHTMEAVLETAERTSE